MKYCTFCKPAKVDAIYRDRINFACECHKHFLEEDKRDDYFTEADYQTWMRY